MIYMNKTVIVTYFDKKVCFEYLRGKNTTKAIIAVLKKVIEAIIKGFRLCKSYNYFERVINQLRNFLSPI